MDGWIMVGRVVLVQELLSYLDEPAHESDPATIFDSFKFYFNFPKKNIVP
jgi:hypothetical protein